MDGQNTQLITKKQGLLTQVKTFPLDRWNKSPTLRSHRGRNQHGVLPNKLTQLNTMNNIIKGAFSASVIAGSLALVSCGGKTDSEKSGDAVTTAVQELVITAIPDKKMPDQSVKYKALTEYLEAKLNVKVKFINSPSYDAAINHFVQNEAQLVWFGGLTGVKARAAVEGSRAIAQGTVDPNYMSYFIAHKSTGLQPSETFPSAIKDLTFMFGSKTSTSGRLMPTWFIQKETGKTVDEFFSQKYQFSTGSHVGTAKAVNAGSVQAGVLSYKTYDKLPDEDKANTSIIWKTPGYSDYNFTAHPSLGEDFMNKLQTALIECKDPKVLEALARKEGIIKAKNSDFDGIVKVAEELNLLR